MARVGSGDIPELIREAGTGKGCLSPWPTAHPDPRSGHYTEMGRLVADAGKWNWEELTAKYGTMLMDGLSVMGTRGKHVNELQHLVGFLKNHLSSEDKAYLR